MIESSIAWIDFSEEDRRKMIELVALFKQRDTGEPKGTSLGVCLLIRGWRTRRGATASKR